MEHDEVGAGKAGHLVEDLGVVEQAGAGVRHDGDGAAAAVVTRVEQGLHVVRPARLQGRVAARGLLAGRAAVELRAEAADVGLARRGAGPSRSGAQRQSRERRRRECSSAPDHS
jgi:hypothetical protein